MPRSLANISNAVNVMTTDTLVLAANENRVECTFVNDGSNLVYLQMRTPPAGSAQPSASRAAVVGQGVRLNANGGSYTTTNYRGEVRGIAVTGATSITVLEL